MEGINPYFGVVDYCAFVTMLLVSLGIGVFISIKGNKSPEEFLMGNRSFHFIPVAMSLLTSVVSSISILGYSAEIYLYGIQYTLFLSGSILGITAAKYITIPVLYPLRLISINEYIELRFKSKALRTFIMLLGSINGLIYLGVCLYAPTIALSSVTPLSSNTYIFLLGGICTVYSTIGGIKAVVWTDVFQLIVMLFGLTSIVILGCINLGGIVKVWSIAAEGGRLNLFNMNPSIYERYNFYNTVAFGFYFFFSIFGCSQMNVQRMCAVRTMNDAKQVLNFNIFGMLLVYFLIFTSGLIGYATYVTCDPLLSGKIERAEQIVPYFVIDKLGHIWGLPGLFVATLVGGTLSSLSSVINALVAQIWKDGFMQFQRFHDLSPSAATMINKCISIVIGILLIGFAILASKAPSLIQLTNVIISAAFGPILGVFSLGLLVPRFNLKGAWSGLIVSFTIMVWMALGSFRYGPKAKYQPFSTEKCDNFTQSIEQTNGNQSFILNDNLEETITFDFPLQRLYTVSYMWYSIIGPTLCIVIGLLVSFATGQEDLSNVNPEHITPFIRRRYWDSKSTKNENILLGDETISKDKQVLEKDESLNSEVST